MDVFSLLPFLDGWRYEPVDIVSPILCSRRREIVNIKKTGWCLWGAGIVNNKNAKIIVTYDNVYSADTTPFELHAGSLRLPSAAGFWLGTYDETLNIYSVFLTPPYPWPMKENIRLEVEPPTGETVIVSTLSMLMVIIEDEKAFLKSLERVLKFG